jgi:hypothetical protein
MNGTKRTNAILPAQAVEPNLKQSAAVLIHAVIREKWAGRCPNGRVDLLG